MIKAVLHFLRVPSDVWVGLSKLEWLDKNKGNLWVAFCAIPTFNHLCSKLQSILRSSNHRWEHRCRKKCNLYFFEQSFGMILLATLTAIFSLCCSIVISNHCISYMYCSFNCYWMNEFTQVLILRKAPTQKKEFFLIPLYIFLI